MPYCFRDNQASSISTLLELLYPEEEVNTILRNVGKYLPKETTCVFPSNTTIVLLNSSVSAKCFGLAVFDCNTHSIINMSQHNGR